ncbi:MULTISPECIES: hypothetical protein [unclassified Streptomyces]|uniref:hypothetical protein n=1 Tax=unclassified Streptomyces TaxID=2593676 RepID=UPI0028C483DF|nr:MULTISPECIES: hypothetical protein [unclassified Streptomyces]WNO76224.1 hypothetical protein RPQ07_33445 [Streptomyces sp. AM8-1-1]
MTEIKTTRRANDSMWALPLAALAPLVLLRLLTEPSTPWLALSWALCVASALLLAAGWAALRQHGIRGNTAWGTCVLVHLVWAWQVVALIAE